MFMSFRGRPRNRKPISRLIIIILYLLKYYFAGRTNVIIEVIDVINYKM